MDQLPRLPSHCIQGKSELHAGGRCRKLQVRKLVSFWFALHRFAVFMHLNRLGSLLCVEQHKARRLMYEKRLIGILWFAESCFSLPILFIFRFCWSVVHYRYKPRSMHLRGPPCFSNTVFSSDPGERHCMSILQLRHQPTFTLTSCLLRNYCEAQIESNSPSLNYSQRHHSNVVLF